MDISIDDRVEAFVGFIVGVSMIGGVIWHTGWRNIYATVVQADLLILAVSVLFSIAAPILLGTTWWIIVRDVGQINLLDGIRLFLATMFANTVTPFGQIGGEPFIAYLLSRGTETPYEESIGAVMAADIVNAIPFFTLSITGIAIFLLTEPMIPVIETILKGMGVLLGVLLLLFIVLWRYEPQALRLLGYIGCLIEKTMDVIGRDRLDAVDRDFMVTKGKNFFDVFHTLLRHRRQVGVALLVTHAAGLAGITGVYFMIVALGFSPPFSALLFIVPASMVASYLPMPGGIGGIEVMMTALLVTVTSVSTPIASSAVLLNRVTKYTINLGAGGYFASQLSIDIFGDHNDVDYVSTETAD